MRKGLLAAVAVTLLAPATAGATAVVVGGPTPPKVTYVYPAEGVHSGQEVSVIGANLEEASAVDFGSAAASFVIHGPLWITATVPPGSGSAVPVTVTTPEGTSPAVGLGQFVSYFMEPPAPEPVEPPAGSPPASPTASSATPAASLPIPGTSTALPAKRSHTKPRKHHKKRGHHRKPKHRKRRRS